MKLKVFLWIAQGFLCGNIGEKCEENISGHHLKWERIQAWYMTTSLCFEFSFSFSSDRATMYNTETFKGAIVQIWVLDC